MSDDPWELIQESVQDRVPTFHMMGNPVHVRIHEQVWRFEVPGGWLYRVGSGIAFVPHSTDTQGTGRGG